MKKKCRPLCETPRSNIFCGPDKYLQLQEYTISQEMFPVLEIDSYFILVREGKGVFIINGEEFSVEPGCVSWIQGSQVLTICPNFGEQLHIWVCAYDYQLLSYYTFNKISLNVEAEIVNGLPVVGPARVWTLSSGCSVSLKNWPKRIPVAPPLSAAPTCGRSSCCTTG